MKIHKYILGIIFLVLCGCSPKTITIIERHDSIITRTRTDTLRLLQYDSIYVHQKQDTVFIEKFKTLYKDHTRLIRDTIYIDKVKTIKAPETKKKGGNFKVVAITALVTYLVCMIIGFILGIILWLFKR